MGATSIIYEVNLAVQTSIMREFDAWLSEQHIVEMLQLPGFESAEIFRPEPDSDRQTDDVLITVQYTLSSRVDLDAYFRDHAERMRAAGTERFPGGFTASRRILRTQGSVIAGDASVTTACMNCGSALIGQYCAACGQRHRERMITVWELAGDLFRDLISLDSRLWRSLVPLLTKPGFLTREYLEGRRVRYTPPLRLYLALSIVFFLYIAIQAPFAGLEENITALSNANVDAPDSQIATGEQGPEAPRNTGNFDCDNLQLNIDGESILADPLVMARAKTACQRLSTPEGRRAFFRSLVDNIPAMLFLFLPLIALLNKVLYVFARRYYVEHLLFFLHYHSFIFLLLLVTVLINKALALVPFGQSISGWLNLAVTLYVGYYLYRSLRSVYTQGRILTISKQIVLTLAYVVGLSLTITIGALVAAATV